MAWIKCTEEAYKKCPFSKTCGDAENAIFMDGSDCDKFNQSIKQTTVDAVPVVRCRDCKHMYRDNVGVFCKVWNGYNGCSYDGFCNYGERKEVVDDGKDETV